MPRIIAGMADFYVSFSVNLIYKLFFSPALLKLKAEFWTLALLISFFWTLVYCSLFTNVFPVHMFIQYILNLIFSDWEKDTLWNSVNVPPSKDDEHWISCVVEFSVGTSSRCKL